jgi:hypothetical protein
MPTPSGSPGVVVGTSAERNKSTDRGGLMSTAEDYLQFAQIAHPQCWQIRLG